MPLEAQKEVEIPCASSYNCKGRDGTTVVELLDEYWFFHNMLDKGRILTRLPLLLASPQSKVEVSSSVKRPLEQDGLVSTPKSLEDDTSNVRTLLRTPSLPPRVRQPETSQDETSPSSLSSSKLRHSSSTLQCDQPGAASSPCSSSKETLPQTSIITRHRPPRDTKFEGISRYSTNQRYMAGESKWRKAFREKKWKSLSDLEHEEVQGFKDLGFVFDKEDLNASLVRVIPGLRGGQPIEDFSKVQRPYLSEAWLAQGSAPPMRIGWVNNRSADDMKEQLRFWARAVACNVRQEC